MTTLKPLKIAMGDLLHSTVGRHSHMMPLSIGYVGSYALARLGAGNAELKLFTVADEMFDAIDTWHPKVIGMANYCWNTSIAMTVFRYAKEQDPNVICIGGGPEFPPLAEAQAYMAERPYVDFYSYAAGEPAFAELVEKIRNGPDLAELKKEPQAGMAAIHPATGKLVVGAEAPRLMDMDVIPSPYLTGMMDKFFDGQYGPSIETARGCPFTCTFCVQGDVWYTKIAKFSDERVKADLTYMAKKMADYPGPELGIYDSNFGMYKRDEEYGEHIRHLQDTYGWPNAINVSTGKGNWDRIMHIAERVRHVFAVSCSVQSMDDTTLEAISRKNMPMDKYKEVVAGIKSRGGIALAETIVPLPGETKASFFEGLRKLSDAGIETFIPFTTMMLKGTELASPEVREKYGMTTRYRVLPKRFGSYREEKCYEIEEVCISTNTMSFDEYLDCRGFGFVCALLTNKQYEPAQKLAVEAGFSLYEWYYAVWQLITSQQTELTPIYQRFIDDSKDELFLSESDIYRFFDDDDNYRKLCNEEFGGNVTRKNLARVLLEKFESAVELACRPFRQHFSASDGLLDAVGKWMVMTRDVGEALRDTGIFASVDLLDLPFDVEGWYRQTDEDKKPLTAFERPTRYRVTADEIRMESILNSQRDLRGSRIEDLAMSLFANSRRPPDLWRRCEEVAPTFALP